jgi:hypothetical protein
MSIITGIGGNHGSVWLIALIVAAVIVFAYVIGASMRYLITAAYNLIYIALIALFTVTGLNLRWYDAKRRFRTLIEPPGENYPMRWRRQVTAAGQEYDLTKPLGIAAFAWMTIRSRNPSGKQLWEALTTAYGEERVASALAAHPIPVPVEHPWQIPPVIEYCRLWLNKYAPDMAITSSATSYLIATTAFIPVLLLPGSLISAFGPMAAVHRWAWLWPLIAVVLLYLIVTSPRSPRTTFQIFYRFVTVQLIEQSRGEQQEGTAAFTDPSSQARRYPGATAGLRSTKQPRNAPKWVRSKRRPRPARKGDTRHSPYRGDPPLR